MLLSCTRCPNNRQIKFRVLYLHKLFCGVDIFENPRERENMCAEFTRDIKFMFALERVELYLLVTSFTLVCSGSSYALKNKNVHIQNHWCVVEGISLNAFLCADDKNIDISFKWRLIW